MPKLKINFKKILAGIILTFNLPILLIPLTSINQSIPQLIQTAQAQQTQGTQQKTEKTAPSSFTRTLLPEVDEGFKGSASCRLLMIAFEEIYFNSTDKGPTAEFGTLSRFEESRKLLNKQTQYAKVTQNGILGCSIVTGRIKSFYISVFISYVLNMGAILSGSISMLFIMIGGYQYVVGSLTQNTDGAKKTITNAIIGLSVSISAWIIVNIVLAVISS